MISILISVYNIDPGDLVQDLLKQINDMDYPSEIIIGDDASDAEFIPSLNLLDKLPGVNCIYSEKNQGRSRNRNQMAEKAKYPYLLFIDGDAQVQKQNFISAYLKRAEKDKVICGGTAYSSDIPVKKEEYLRWKYGINREARPAKDRSDSPYSSFSSFNFFIPAETFSKIRFNEEILRYGHEDTVFGIELERNNISIDHIDNQLIHNGLDSSDVFLKKTREGLSNLLDLWSDYEYPEALLKHIRLLNQYNKLRKWRLHFLISIIYMIFERAIEKNLTGPSPSMAILDLYKLCILNKIKA